MNRKLFFSLISLSLWLSSAAQTSPQNVQIYAREPGSYNPCEPSIAIDPDNPDIMVAGAVLDYVYTSRDGGLTWKTDRLKSSLGVWGDPCILALGKKDFLYFHLSSPSGEGWANPDILDRIVSQRSKNGGKKWSDGAGIGLNGSKDQDKEWAVYDPLNGHIMVTWTEFDNYGDVSDSCHSRILFAGSSDRGKTWSTAFAFSEQTGNCIDDSKTVEGAVPAVDHEGRFYTTWSNGGKLWFYAFPRIDGFHKGFSWSDDDSLASYFNNPSIGEVFLNKPGFPKREPLAITDKADWAFDIPGVGRANGMPITKCDLSNGPNRGTIYVNWADQRNGEDDTDIWLMKSTDKGKTWSAPKRVNDDPPGKQQFFTWMDVDPVTGYIYVVFYDRRNHDGNATDVYLGVSRDGGETFENRRISESPFTPSTGTFFGDYNNISAYDGIVRPIWTRHDNGTQSIWTAIIDEKEAKE